MDEQSIPQEAEYEAAFRHGRQSNDIQNHGEMPYAVIGKDSNLTLLPGLEAAPRRAKVSPVMEDPFGFINYAKKFIGVDSVLFADREAETLTIILDYHSVTAPSWEDHKAILQLVKSQEWNDWVVHSGEMMPQEDFLKFIQENMEDFLKPSGGQLLEICNNLKGQRSTQFEFGKNLQNGDIVFNLCEKTTGENRRTIKIPEQFLIKIPIFRHCPPVELPVWFRYEIRDSGPRFSFSIHRMDRALEDQFKAVVAKAADKTGLTAWHGIPRTEQVSFK